MHDKILLLLMLPLFATHAAANDSPNIVFIFIDDMGYGDLSCFRELGASAWNPASVAHYPRTLHIDALASQGLRLTNFYVASPICSPSRVGCTTGQFPSRHLINSYLNHRERNQQRGMADFLDPNVPAIARFFQKHGYATAHFGKWHQGGGRDVDNAPHPAAYGFDESLVSFEGLGDRILPPGRLSDQSERLGQGAIRRVPKHLQTEIYVDRSIDFLKRSRERPVYLHLWLNDVHDGHNPAPGAAQKFAAVTESVNEQKFFAVLLEMDRQIGRFIDAIDQLELTEQTLVVLTSDNGPTAWPRYYRNGRDPAGSTAGFRGRKWSLYEGGIRMPLIARWPGKIEKNVVNQELIFSTLDFFPTFAALAGLDLQSEISLPSNEYFDGEDLSHILLGAKGQRTKPLFWEYGRDDTYLRPGLSADISPNLAMRDGRWKFLINADGTNAELYDFSVSDTETMNVATDHPAVAKRLQHQLLNWRNSLPTLQD